MGKPDPSWPLAQLGQFAKYHEEQFRQLGKKMAVHRFREGYALSLAHEQVPYGQWGKFLEQHGISTSSDDRARELYEKAGSEERIAGMTITEAYTKYGIEKPRKPKAKEASYDSLITSLSAAIPQDAAIEEILPDDLPTLESACEETRTQMGEVRNRIKASMASDEDEIRHSVLFRRWLMLVQKRDQARARQERQERLRAGQARRLEELETDATEAVKLLVLLEETCHVMEELHKVVRSVDPKLTERQEFTPLCQRFSELTEDLSLRLMPM